VEDPRGEGVAEGRVRGKAGGKDVTLLTKTFEEMCLIDR
jgi:hypothetical protein